MLEAARQVKNMGGGVVLNPYNLTPQTIDDWDMAWIEDFGNYIHRVEGEIVDRKRKKRAEEEARRKNT